MNRKDSFNTFAGYQPSNGEGGGDAVASPMCDHNAGKHLDSLLGAFLNSAMNVDSVADFER